MGHGRVTRPSALRYTALLLAGLAVWAGAAAPVRAQGAAPRPRANGLNALGREQARQLGERLAALPVRISRLMCSDFTRARETAAILGQALGMSPVEDTLLHECSPGSDWADSTMIHRSADGARC